MVRWSYNGLISILFIWVFTYSVFPVKCYLYFNNNILYVPKDKSTDHISNQYKRAYLWLDDGIDYVCLDYI
jgi:hypothetical protein